MTLAGHILHLYCVRLSNAALFCENHTKLHFDAKHLEKGLNGGKGCQICGALFSKKCPFLIKRALSSQYRMLL